MPHDYPLKLIIYIFLLSLRTSLCFVNIHLSQIVKLCNGALCRPHPITTALVMQCLQPSLLVYRFIGVRTGP